MTRHRSRSSPPRGRRSRPGTGTLLRAVVGSACVLAVVLVAGRIRTDTTPTDAAPSDQEAVGANTGRVRSPEARSDVYPYSVVAGGVHSPEQLREAVSNDPVVALHYADVAVQDTRVTHVSAPRQVYVSYRLADRIYWTRHRVRLQVGESILSDGTIEIRARCGNRISDEPMDPVAPEEPELAEFDRVLAVPPATLRAPFIDPFLTFDPASTMGLPLEGTMLLDESMTLGPEQGMTPVAHGMAIPGVLFDPTLASGLPNDPPGSPSSGRETSSSPVVPEPSSLVLFGTALAAYAIRRRRAR